MAFSNRTGKPVDAKRSAAAKKAAATRMWNERKLRNENVREMRLQLAAQEDAPLRERLCTPVTIGQAAALLT